MITELATISKSIALPEARVNIAIRPGVMSDLPFIDALQKKHAKMVGWMPTQQLEGKIASGHVHVAEEVGSLQQAAGRNAGSALPAADCLLPAPLGYCIGHDQYFKRDDVGIIYQLNVLPGKQRGLIGATLLKAMFDRAAYGCRLFCCWCAQDIQANHFWESMGFIPLAFRAGSREKGRVHIFWQRRIRAGDCVTPYWFPSQTTGGSIREDRLVLPIPPGTHWSDEMPVLLPQQQRSEVTGQKSVNADLTSDLCPLISSSLTSDLRPLTPSARTSSARKPMAKPAKLSLSLPWFEKKDKPAEQTGQKPQPKPKTKRVKVKNDPKFVAAARELRDRWLEEVNATPLPSHGKYDVSRQLQAPATDSKQVPLLTAA